MQMNSILAMVIMAMACSSPSRSARREPSPNASTVTLTIIGTNDLHGALDRLPRLAGFVNNMRAARAADGGGVLVVDAGDMFQGTLPSNLGEGTDVVRAYNQIGYAAAAIGNHEFDFGPVGPAVVAATNEDDPRGALKARAHEARFPFLAANLRDTQTGTRIDWPNVPASTMVDVAGVRVGIVGVSTESTPLTTMPANFVGLEVMAPSPAVTLEAAKLRANGAKLIVVVAHLGSNCADLRDPNDDSSCDRTQELFKMLAVLPKGTVDAIVAGHTHGVIAQEISGIPVIESYSSGRAFGRIDFQISPDGSIRGVRIDKPREICADSRAGSAQSCRPEVYEGKPVVADPAVQQIVDTALQRTTNRSDESLGVSLTDEVTEDHDVESPEGNLFCDLMLAARPEAQVAMSNGGSLRASLPAGELTYGELFQAMPFDNRFAIVDVKGKALRRLVTSNLQAESDILSWSGLTAMARCNGETLDVDVMINGKQLDDARTYKVVTSDFLASGGQGVIGELQLSSTAIHSTNVIVREAMADVLRGWKGTPKATIDPTRLLSTAHRRIDYQGDRPIDCVKTEPKAIEPELK